MIAFLHLLAFLAALPCTAVTESTHSTPATEHAVIYGGNCAQAWLLSLKIPGVAWIIGGAA